MGGRLTGLLEGLDLTDWETQFEPQQRWWVPYTNKLATVRGGMQLPERVTIFESTLREGTHSPGRNNLPVGTRLRLLQALEDAGVTEAEVGSYAYGESEEKQLVREAKRTGIGIRMGMHSAGWVKDYKAEVDRLAECGIDMVNFVLFGTSGELAMMPWLTPDHLPERAHDLVTYAKQQGVVVGFGLASCGRTHPVIEEACYQAAAQAGADRVYCYDGFGVMIPEVVRYQVRRIRDYIGPDIEIAFHCHNDFGLSTGNSIAAVQAGARVLDATINGIGNRAGITPLEELVTALTVLYGVDTGLDVSKLTGLSRLVEELYGIAVSPSKPVVGRNMYWHESDAHNAGILNGHWDSWNVIRSDAIGRDNVIHIIPQSLHKQPQGTVATKIRVMGLTVTDEQFDRILEELEAVMRSKPRAMATEAELEQIILGVTEPAPA
jgi:isopropylmalate/homocitrate/citramalate synthase